MGVETVTETDNLIEDQKRIGTKWEKELKWQREGKGSMAGTKIGNGIRTRIEREAKNGIGNGNGERKGVGQE